MSEIRLLGKEELDEVVQYYDIELRELLKSQRSKMRRFIRENCVQELGGDRWNILPVKGYNSTTYHVSFDKLTGWDCDCQFKSLEGKDCSHIGTVMLWLMRQKNEATAKQELD